MPELPEVETVRAGLQRWVVGRTVTDVEVRHPRSVRRHAGGAADLVAQLTGATLLSAQRRGKFLWLPLRQGAGLGGASSEGAALVVHLGMSGQLLVQPPRAADEKHLHVRMALAPTSAQADDAMQLRFIDQRTFGGLMVEELVAGVPRSVVHIARDPLDPLFDDPGFITALRRRNSAVKRSLLDQRLISGIGNIYADEALWRARIHGERWGSALRPAQVAELLCHVREVLTEAITAGGTSFDSLYVNVNGRSGYFERSLNAYGREGEPCRRCGRPLRRSAFMNRSSFWCPQCQRLPRPRPPRPDLGCVLRII